MKKVATIMALVFLIGTFTTGCQQGEVKTKENGQETVINKGAVEENTNGAELKEQQSDDGITISFWNPFTGSDGPFLQTIVDEFNKLNEGAIKVESQSLQAGDMYSKIPVAFAAGEGIPDVTVIHLDRIPGYASRGMLKPIGGLLAESGLTGEKFIPTLWDAAEFEGEHYSLPLDTHPIFMYYNKTMLEELGYTEADLADIDYEKFISMCERATVGENYGYAMPYGWVGTTFMTLLYQHGGKMVDSSEPAKAIYNSEAGFAALDQILGMIDAGVVNEPGVENLALFKEGKALFTVDGIWGVNGMNAVEGLDWGAILWPAFGEYPGTWASSHQMVVFDQDVSPEKEEAIISFMKYLSDNSLEWAKAGQIPANVEVLNSEGFAELKWGFAADHMEAFQYPDPVVTYGDIEGPIWPVLADIVQDNIEAVEGLNLAAEESSQKAQELLDSLE